jgi:hypothetical protein
MSQQHVDALARRAAASISRRGSLASLGGAGVAALLGSSLVADAKKSGKSKINKKIKKKQYLKCQAQIAQCQAFVLANFNGSAVALPCCNFLGTCDFTTTGNCLVANSPP